jgi:Integrase zinc binding domain
LIIPRLLCLKWSCMETTCHQSPILLHPFGAATSNPEILHEAHGHLLSGHFGISKTNECLLQSYYWPNMKSDISEHWQCFNKCQVTKRGKMSPELPLPQCTEPNQRVQADLFGPLKTSEYWNNISSDIHRRNLIRRQAQNIFFCK